MLLHAIVTKNPKHNNVVVIMKLISLILSVSILLTTASAQHEHEPRGRGLRGSEGDNLEELYQTQTSLASDCARDHCNYADVEEDQVLLGYKKTTWGQCRGLFKAVGGANKFCKRMGFQ